MCFHGCGARATLPIFGLSFFGSIFFCLLLSACPLPPTQPRLEQPISKNKSPLPKLTIKGGDPTTLTRVINEWVQKTAIALNTWSLEASQFWTQSVNSARDQRNQWLSLTPSDRAAHIGLPMSFQSVPSQVPILDATLRAEPINSALPEKVTSTAMQKEL